MINELKIQVQSAHGAKFLVCRVDGLESIEAISLSLEAYSAGYSLTPYSGKFSDFWRKVERPFQNGRNTKKEEEEAVYIKLF